jgi:hypothetical protein
MAALTIDKAAFHGFGLIRRDPLTFLGVAILLSVLGAAFALILIPAYVEFMVVILETPMQGEPDPLAVLEATAGLFGAMVPLYAVMLPVYAVILGALHRSLVFGKSKGWVLGLKIGMDEVRAFLVTVVGYILGMVPYLICAFVAVVVGAVLGAAGATAGSGEPNPGFIVIAGLLIVVGYIVGIVLMIWVGVRLSYAAPASVGERRFVIFESWSMTKGSFWTLFLAYLIVFLLIYLGELVVFAIVVAASSGWIASVDWENADPRAFADVSISPVLIGGAVLYGVVATFISGAFFGVASRGYVAWKEGATPRQEPT